MMQRLITFSVMPVDFIPAYEENTDRLLYRFLKNCHLDCVHLFRLNSDTVKQDGIFPQLINRSKEQKE